MNVCYPPPKQEVEKEPYSNLIDPKIHGLELENKIYKRMLDVYRKSFLVPKEFLDEAGKLILPITKLKEFIADILSIEIGCVNVNYNVEVSCCGVSVINDITDVKIRYGDGLYRSLKIFHNEIYNKITEDYNISLCKVLTVQ